MCGSGAATLATAGVLYGVSLLIGDETPSVKSAGKSAANGFKYQREIKSGIIAYLVVEASEGIEAGIEYIQSKYGDEDVEAPVSMLRWEFDDLMTEQGTAKDGYTWNYCSAVDWERNFAIKEDADGETIAYATYGEGSQLYRLVDYNEDTEYTEGVQLVQYGSSLCELDESQRYSWTTNLWCVKGQADVLISGPTEDGCTTEVTYAGETGCPVDNSSPVVKVSGAGQESVI